MIVVPIPETAVTATNQSPEAFVALVTLIVIGCGVYGLSKIKLSSFRWLTRLLFKGRGITQPSTYDNRASTY